MTPSLSVPPEPHRFLRWVASACSSACAERHAGDDRDALPLPALRFAPHAHVAIARRAPSPGADAVGERLAARRAHPAQLGGVDDAAPARRWSPHRSTSSRMLQQVTAPSAFASSDTSTTCTSTPRPSSTRRVRGNAEPREHGTGPRARRWRANGSCRIDRDHVEPVEQRRAQIHAGLRSTASSDTAVTAVLR